MSPPQRRFLLRKWYLDCVTEDGSAVVAYWASLCWGALRMRYAALLCGATGRDAWQIHTLRPGAPPSLEGERCDWQCPRLGLTGSWTARAGRVGRVLLRTAEGGIRWVCHQPAADVRVDILRPGAPAITLRGSGYVEELTRAARHEATLRSPAASTDLPPAARTHREGGPRTRLAVDADRATKTAVQVFHTIPIRWLDVDLTEALQLAAQLEVYAYDAYIIAAAQTQKCPILALDGGLVHAAKVAGIPVLEVNR
jgi:predicted nucleic acid-binding protein